MKLKLSFCFAALFAPLITHAADFEVKGYGVHTAVGVTYHYSVFNNTASNLADPWHVHSIEIGRRISDTRWESPELTGLPPITSPRSGMLIYPGNGVLAMTAPAGWNGVEGGEQEHINHTLWWELDEDAQGETIRAAALLPGQTLTGLSATRLTANATYLNSSFAIRTLGITGPGTGSTKKFNGVVQKQDNAPPTLSVSLSPATLRPPNNKLVPITATITVKDDYDPQPQIKLESITANEPLEKEDIKDAKLGTDARQFKLKAEREGKNKAGRIYTVTYSATDASGNKTTASATVTVPHDRAKKDD